MAKLIIPLADLPAPSIVTSDYEIRYRLASEDQNRVSAWTPIFTVNPELIYTPGSGPTILYTDSGLVTASWDSTTISKAVNGTEVNVGYVNEYDIWYRWSNAGQTNSSNWYYLGRVASKSISISVPTSYTPSAGGSDTTGYFDIEIYRPSKEKIQDSLSSFLMNSGSAGVTVSTVQIAQDNALAMAVVL